MKVKKPRVPWMTEDDLEFESTAKCAVSEEDNTPLEEHEEKRFIVQDRRGDRASTTLVAANEHEARQKAAELGYGGFFKGRVIVTFIGTFITRK